MPTPTDWQVGVGEAVRLVGDDALGSYRPDGLRPFGRRRGPPIRRLSSGRPFGREEPPVW